MTNEIDYRRGYRDGLNEALHMVMKTQVDLMKMVLEATDILRQAKEDKLKNQQEFHCLTDSIKID